MYKSVSTIALVLALGACATTAPPAPSAPPVASAAPAAPAAPAAAAPPAAPAAPAPNTQAVSRVIDLGQNVSMLMGQGGNLGLLVGPDGVFMIDDQYATNAIANLAKIEEVAKGKPKFLVNTHWHGDHAGGNEVFAQGWRDRLRQRQCPQAPVRRGQVSQPHGRCDAAVS